jgi:hypothetical protein
MTDKRFVRCTECGALNEPRAVFCSRCGAALPGAALHSPSPRFNSTSVAVGAALLVGLSILAFFLYNSIARSLDGTESVALYAGQKGVPATLPSESSSTTVKTDANGVPVTTAGSATDPSAATTTTDPPVSVRPKATVSSSALKGTGTASFQATNLVDGDLTTAWLEGAKGSGPGEWVRFEFAQPTLLSRIEIANGYQKDPTHFASNPRIKLVNVEFSSGATYLVQLHDVTDPQTIIPVGEAIEWVKLVIVSVYPGQDNQDAALTEVRLLEKVD